MTTMFQFFSWKSVPFVRFILPLILGIVMSVFFHVPAIAYWLLLGYGAVGILITLQVRDIDWRIRLENGMWLFLAPLLFGLGAYLVDMHMRTDETAHFQNSPSANYAQVQILETPQAKAKSIKLIAEVKQVTSDSIWTPSLGKLLIYLESSEQASEMEIGDVLIMPLDSRAVTPPANPGEFDYKRFLSFRDIYHQQYLKSGTYERVASHWSPRKQAERWRSYLLDRLALIDMDSDEQSIASALLLGKKDDLSLEQQKSYASAGAMHVLAVSGLHVGIIYFILKSLLKFLNRWKRMALLKAILLIAGLWIYAFVTGLSPSVVRAATMFTAVTLGTGLGRRSSIYNTVASSAFILLLFNPLYIMEVGFQLSYLAVLGIIYLYDKIYNLIYIPNSLLDKFWQISAVSIAAQLATFPLGLLYFHQFPSYFLLSNILVIPAAFLILYVGFAYLAFGWLPWVGIWIGKLLGFIIYVLNAAVAWVQSLPYSLIQGIDISILDTWLIYLMIGAGAIALIYKKRGALQLTIATTVILLGLQLHEVFTYKRYPHLVVYDVRGKSVVNLLSEDINLVYCDSTLAGDESKQQFHLRNNWNRHGAPEPVFARGKMNAMEMSAGPLQIWQGRKVCMLDDRQDLLAIPAGTSIDYLIISYHKGLNMEQILKQVSPRQIILDATVRGKTIERICAQAAGHTIHTVAEDGYFSAAL